jgi:hypothetical protein
MDKKHLPFSDNYRVVVCFLLRNSLPSEFYMPMFQNTLSVPSSWAGTCLCLKMEQTECSEMSVHKIQTQGNYPEESIKHSEHGESLKSRITILFVTHNENKYMYH